MAILMHFSSQPCLSYTDQAALARLLGQPSSRLDEGGALGSTFNLRALNASSGCQKGFHSGVLSRAALPSPVTGNDGSLVMDEENEPPAMAGGGAGLLLCSPARRTKRPVAPLSAERRKRARAMLSDSTTGGAGQRTIAMFRVANADAIQANRSFREIMGGLPAAVSLNDGREMLLAQMGV